MVPPQEVMRSKIMGEEGGAGPSWPLPNLTHSVDFIDPQSLSSSSALDVLRATKLPDIQGSLPPHLIVKLLCS